MKDMERIDQYCADNSHRLCTEFIALLGALVAVRTVNVVAARLAEFPYMNTRGEERRATAPVREWAAGEGFESQTFARIPERENLVLHYGRGHGRRLFVPCHTDIVPPGDGWDSDPFELQVEGDEVRGRGVTDNKGPLVASLLALKILKEAGVELDGELQIGALADEEATDVDGEDYGLIYMLDAGLVQADYAIVPDIGGQMRDIDIAEKGIVNYEIIAKGRQAHGSTPERGINAIDNMAEYLQRLKEHRFAHEPHPVLGSYSVNVGEIRGGAAPNIVPGSCTAVVDMRLVPGQSVEGVRAELLKLAEGLTAEFAIEVKMRVDSHEISPDSPLIARVADAAEAVLGERPRTMGLGGGTYAKFLNHRGIEAIGFAPGKSEAMHMANESASISEHLDFARILARAAVLLAN
jgi:succinyl-diaminopimelate desuccinylase